MKNELVPISRNCDKGQEGNWSGYLSESNQTQSEDRRRVSAFYVAKQTGKQTNLCLVYNIKKKIPQSKKCFGT